MPRLAVLDGYRAYAILAIVCLHILGLSGALEAARETTPALLTWTLLGNGIDVLFIITGFVLFLPTVARGGAFGSVRRFAIGRAARLVPAYWVVLALVIVLLAYSPAELQLASPNLASVAAHLTFLQMPAKLLDTELLIGFGLDGPVWMLSVLAGFYVVLPALARAYYRHPFIGLAIAAAITFAWKWAVTSHAPFFTALGGGAGPEWIAQLVATDQLPGWAFSFALGMTWAWAYVRLLERRTRAVIASRAILVAAIALPVYVLFAYIYARAAYATSSAVSGGLARLSPWATLGNSASRAVLMAAIALLPASLLVPLVNRFTARLAELGYGLYLIHVVVGTYLGVALGLPTDGSPGTVALWFLIVLPLSLLWAYVSVRFVERPALRWARRVTRPSGAREPVVAVQPVSERAGN